MLQVRMKVDLKQDDSSPPSRKRRGTINLAKEPKTPINNTKRFLNNFSSAQIDATCKTVSPDKSVKRTTQEIREDDDEADSLDRESILLSED